VSIPQISPYGTNGVSATTYVTPAKKTYQAAKATQIPAQKAYTVHLSGEALARSLQLQGYSITMIAFKMGVDIKTVDLYLGITT
jgi:predicted transcriptional regulator